MKGNEELPLPNPQQGAPNSEMETVTTLWHKTALELPGQLELVPAG